MRFRVFDEGANPSIDSPAFKLSEKRGLEEIAAGRMTRQGTRDLVKIAVQAPSAKEMVAGGWEVVHRSALPPEVFRQTGLRWLMISTEQLIT